MMTKSEEKFALDIMKEHINGIGWSISTRGELDRAECYDMK